MAATKVTGKLSGTDVAFLSAFDDRDYSRDGSRPMYNILRVQRDLGSRSRIGMAYTDKIDGEASNRVLDVDGRLVFRDLYSLQFQAAGSRDVRDGTTVTAPLWDLRLVRSGRAFGLDYRLGGISEDFRTQSGFISRPGLGRASASHRYTIFGERGSLVERFNTELVADGIWKYRNFVRGDEALEKKLHLNTTASLRGGWSAGASVLVEQFGYDPDLYAGYQVEIPATGGAPSDTVPFTGTPRLNNLDWVINLGTPRLTYGSASLFLIWGKDENFYEWAPSDVRIGTLTVTCARPTSCA